jgi:hypothetical protein
MDSIQPSTTHSHTVTDIRSRFVCHGHGQLRRVLLLQLHCLAACKLIVLLLLCLCVLSVCALCVCFVCVLCAAKMGGQGQLAQLTVGGAAHGAYGGAAAGGSAAAAAAGSSPLPQAQYLQVRTHMHTLTCTAHSTAELTHRVAVACVLWHL